MNTSRKLALLGLLENGHGFPCDRIYRDEDFILATDGHHLLAFELDPLERHETAVTSLPDLAAGAATSARPYSVEVIRAYFDAPLVGSFDGLRLLTFLRSVEYRACPCCHGTGERPLLIDFDAYSERPADDPFERNREAVIGGIRVDANKLVALLAWLPAIGEIKYGTAGIRVSDENAGAGLLLAGAGWRLFQAGLRPNENVEPEVFEQ